MIKATHFRHPMKFTGNYHGGHWSGYRYKEPLGYTSGLHTGVDYNRDVAGRDGNADEGDVVYAIAAGKVVYKGDLTSRGYGLTVIIEHHLSDSLKKALGTDKLYSRYMHLSYYGHLNLNSWVNIGHEIANVGRTGTQWAHLHIDLWKGNLGAHLEYHKDTQLASYLNPYTTIESYKTAPKSPAPNPPKGDKDMTDQFINNAYLIAYGRVATASERSHHKANSTPQTLTDGLVSDKNRPNVKTLTDERNAARKEATSLRSEVTKLKGDVAALKVQVDNLKEELKNKPGNGSGGGVDQQMKEDVSWIRSLLGKVFK